MACLVGTVGFAHPLFPNNKVVTKSSFTGNSSSLILAKNSHFSLLSAPYTTKTTASVASNPSLSHKMDNSVDQVERVELKNFHGEKLVGLLHETGSTELVILCHGFRSSKESSTIVSFVSALTKEGISAFHFDFAGNGESEGSFQYGNYSKEADDLRAAVLHFSDTNHVVAAILGHSKGGNVVLIYASKYHDVPKVINVSGRFDLKKGIGERLAEDYLQRIKKDGFIDVKDRSGKVQYRVTEDSLMERLNTDMHAASIKIEKNCRVLTIHGSLDEVIPVEDAFEFAKLIPNHELHLLEGADHCYTKHQVELADVVLNFLKS